MSGIIRRFNNKAQGQTNLGNGRRLTNTMLFGIVPESLIPPIVTHVTVAWSVPLYAPIAICRTRAPC